MTWYPGSWRCALSRHAWGGRKQAPSPQLLFPACPCAGHRNSSRQPRPRRPKRVSARLSARVICEDKGSPCCDLHPSIALQFGPEHPLQTAVKAPAEYLEGACFFAQPFLAIYVRPLFICGKSIMLRTHWLIQNRIVAAIQMAEKKVWAQRS